MDDNGVVKVKLIKPHKKQQEILDAYKTYRFIVVKAGRRFGKSVITHQVCVKDCLSHNDFRVAYITPAFSLGKKFYNEILNILPKSLITKQNISDLTIQFVNGSTIQFYSGDTMDSLNNMRGLNFNLVCVDEAAHIPVLKDAWRTIIRPTLTDYKGKAIFISTPNGKNYFISLYQRDRIDKNYKSFHFTSYDNPHIDPEEIDAAKAELSSVEFEQEYLALETAAKSNPFKNNIEKNIIKNLSDEPTVCFGIDVAKTLDWTVIYGISASGKCTYLKKAQSHSYTVIRKVIMDVKNKFVNVPCVLDCTGVGTALYDMICFNEQGDLVVENVHKFLFTQKSKIKIFNELIKDTEDSNVQYTQATADEMSTIQMTFSANGYPKYEAQSGFTDDIVCAFAIANSFRKKINYYSDWSLEAV